MLEAGICEDREAWNAYVSGHPAATQYHAYEWLLIIERSFKHLICPLVATEAGRIRGVFPLVQMQSRLFGKRAVSLPFVNYGGMLADDEEGRVCLWRAGIRLAKSWGAASLESREFVAYEPAEYTKAHKVTMLLTLASSVEAQWMGFDAKLRNQIRKAERSGLSVRVGGMQDVGGFYEVFARNMRDLGTPVYGRRFFEEVLKRLPGAASIHSVCLNEKVIGACLALDSGSVVEVPWASSLREYRNLCPNNLMYWAVIQAAIKSGRATLDLGRSTIGEGTYKFKEQWGAKAMSLYWNYWLEDPSRKPDLTKENPKYRLAITAWKRLPVWATKIMGPTIVRNIP